MKNVLEVFRLCPELEKVGTAEQYEKYLETVFPESKVKNILWHGSKSEKVFNEFNEPTVELAWGKGIYFRKNLEGAQKDMERYVFLKTTVPAVANVEKPFYPTNQGNEWANPSLYDSVLNDEYNEYVIFDKNNIHILGSEPDIEKFSEFVAREQK